MERYSIELAVDLMNRLDLIEQLSEWRSPDQLCRDLPFQPRFKIALGWILQRLIETGCIEKRTQSETGCYRLRDTLWQPELEHLRDMGVEIDPGNAATFALLDHAAKLYPAVARGEQSGDQALFAPEGIPLWLNYFHNDNLTYAVNNLIAGTLAANHAASTARLRILELGAGAGSASEALIRCLDERGLLPRVERYLITEPNAFFRRRAQRGLTNQYPELPLEWGAIDLDLPFDKQDIGPGDFDLVFAVNVLHVSKDLLFSLSQARSALSGDGCLVLGECVRPYANQPMYPEFMFQILESFTDVQTDPAFRPNPGFLTTDNWRHAFARAGFGRVEIAPNIDSLREICPHFFTAGICGQTE